MTIAIAPKATLYEHDLNLWVEVTIAKLKARDIGNLDVENLIEELESLAGRDKRELESRLYTLVRHLLKRIYVDMPQEFSGWQCTIREQRRQLKSLLKQSPSLKTIWINAFNEAMIDAIKDICIDYPNSQFPDAWQFSSDIDSMLKVDFWE